MTAMTEVLRKEKIGTDIQKGPDEDREKRHPLQNRREV